MKSCLKPTPPQSPGPEPRDDVGRPRLGCKTVSFCESELVRVHLADDWDRSPTPPARHLSYADLLELKQIRLSLPRAQQPPETASYFPPVLSQVPVNLLPLLPEAPAQTAPPPMLSPTPQHPPPPEPNVEPPSPPATPPPPPPKRFNLSFLPLLDPSSAASSSPPKPSPPKMQPSPSILSVIPPTPTFPHDTGSAPDLQEIGFASEEKASSSNYHLPTPDASPLRATSPLGTPDSAVGEDPLTLSALEGFPEPPQSVPRQHSGSYRSSCTPSPMPDTPQSATPSPDSHPNLHSYFLVRPNLPNHIPTNGAGIPDSPFVDPAHAPRSYFALNKAAPVAPDAQIRTQPPDVASRLQTQTQLKTFLRGIPSPTLNPPSPLALDPETVGASQGAAVPRQSSLRQSTTIRKKRRSVQLIEINGMLIPIGDDEDEDECDESESGQGQTTETPVAGPDQPRPASPSLVPLPASPPRVPVVPLA